MKRILREPNYHPVQPIALYLAGQDSNHRWHTQLMVLFEGDVLSFKFFYFMYQYFCLKTEGRWQHLDSEVVGEICKDADMTTSEVQQLFIVKSSLLVYDRNKDMLKITHEFVMKVFMAIPSQDNMRPFTLDFIGKTEEIIPAFTEIFGEPQAVQMFCRMLDWWKQQRDGHAQPIPERVLARLCTEYGLIWELCEGYLIKSQFVT